ncbi:fumarylacetoacetate hydrolase family protein [Sediminivirga luteola]|uniref:fumarylacetoacetate hydrolase family protein n=1 Tax=Sediminivirga luteola TaxID=1774748 RepID=UPI001F56B563|nr:fumarylacetoacetate hydrolase family protein [Sediminivirga luteola]MCI2266744.1 fumarylacetoacetate hydrolase family protein [Sediminivirga luteola]
MTIRYTRLGPAGGEIPALAAGTPEGTRYYDLRSLTDDIDGAFLASGGLERAAKAFQSGRLPELAGAAELRVGAPVARPHAVVCVGMNYAAHAAESGATPPEVPVIFLKLPNTITGPHDEIVLPRYASRADWEVELGVVIGQRVYQAQTADEARGAIAGFVLANDLSERTAQLDVSGGQWSKGKSFPGFLPLGPWLVPAADVPHADLRLRSTVNGEPRQDSRTSDMVFSVEEILIDLTRYMVLEPGDVILTGTPEGVALSGKFPYLSDGDVVELEIEGLGRQRQQVTVQP